MWKDFLSSTRGISTNILVIFIRSMRGKQNTVHRMVCQNWQPDRKHKAKALSVWNSIVLACLYQVILSKRIGQVWAVTLKIECTDGMTKLAWAGLCMHTLQVCKTPNKQKQIYQFLIWLACLCFSEYMKKLTCFKKAFPLLKSPGRIPCLEKNTSLILREPHPLDCTDTKVSKRIH